MATFPMGNAGRARLGMPSQVVVPDTTAVGRAMQQAGAQVADAAGNYMADEARRQRETADAARRARDAVQLQTAEDKLTDLHDEIGGGVLSGTVPKADAQKLWSEKSRAVLDEQLPLLSEQSRGIVAGRLEGSVNRLGNSLRRTVEKRDRQDVTADMTTRLERLSRDYQADPVKAQEQAMAVFDTLGPFSTLTPEQIAKGRQGWKEQAQFTAGYEAVSAGRADRTALQQAEKLIATLSDLDPQKRAQLMDRAQAYRLHLDQQDELKAARAQREADLRLRVAGAEFETFQALADKGTILDPAYIDRVVQATAGTPYQAGIKALAQAAKDNAGLAAQPLAVQQAALDRLDAHIATAGRSPELDARRQQVEKVLRGAQQDVERDPLRAGVERGVITGLAPLNTGGGLAGMAAQLSQRVQQADRVGVWAGKPVSPFTPDEARMVGRTLAVLPPDQFGDAVATLTQTMPPEQAAALARQIDAQDRPLSLALAAGSSRTTLGRTTAELIKRGAQVMADKKGGVGAKGDASTQQLRSDIYAALGDSLSGQAREDVADAALLINHGLEAVGSKSGADRAVRLAVGGDIVGHNGHKLPVAAGVTLDTLRDRLASMPADLIMRQAEDGKVYSAGSRPQTVAEFLAALPQARLEPAGLGRYFVRQGAGVAVNSKGRPVVVEVR